MKNTLTLIFAAALLATPGLAQRQAPVQKPAHAASVFRSADTNHDAQLTQAEARRAGMSVRQIAAMDKNSDGLITKAEYGVTTQTKRPAKKADGKRSKQETTRGQAERKASAEKVSKASRIAAARAAAARKAEAGKAAARRAAAARKAGAKKDKPSVRRGAKKRPVAKRSAPAAKRPAPAVKRLSRRNG